MENLVYATKINNSELTGLMDISKNPPQMYCYCSKEVAEEILDNRKKNFKIKVYKNDEIDGFATYASPSIKKNEFGVVVFNLEASLGICLEENISFKEMFVETIMHEIGHALEEFYDLEFNEERIEKITDSYRQKYFNDEENKTEIEWREQNTKFGLDYSTKTGKWEDYRFDIRYDYDGNPDEKPKKCILSLTIMKKDKIIEREQSYLIEDLVGFSEIYMLEEQRKFLKANFS